MARSKRKPSKKAEFSRDAFIAVAGVLRNALSLPNDGPFGPPARVRDAVTEHGEALDAMFEFFPAKQVEAAKGLVLAGGHTFDIKKPMDMAYFRLQVAEFLI